MGDYPPPNYPPVKGFDGWALFIGGMVRLFGCAQIFGRTRASVADRRWARQQLQDVLSQRRGSPALLTVLVGPDVRCPIMLCGPSSRRFSAEVSS